MIVPDRVAAAMQRAKTLDRDWLTLELLAMSVCDSPHPAA
jgi:hypothetical protein